MGWGEYVMLPYLDETIVDFYKLMRCLLLNEHVSKLRGAGGGEREAKSEVTTTELAYNVEGNLAACFGGSPLLNGPVLSPRCN